MPKTKTDSYEVPFKKDYQEDWDLHRSYIQTFDSYEAMLIGQVFDSVSNSVDGSKITDSYAATLAIERAARVMGKLPDGETESVAKADQGKAAFMDILRQKWIYPNANSQHNFDTKVRLWQLYSSVYGYMPMFYDWNVSASGYVGPDCWLWNPRNLIPQQGRVSIKDMDYVTALTWVSKKYLQDIYDDQTAPPVEGETENEIENGGWDLAALKVLLDQSEKKTGPDTEKDTQVERTRMSQGSKKGICLATRYEAGEEGEWITFAPDHAYCEVRRLKNPHMNGRIPFVIKYSQPLFDSFYGLGDFQRAKPLQFARDGLTNFYFQGIKNNLVPPLVVNANGVMRHTLDYRPGGVMMETIQNSIRTLEVSSAGLATYKDAQSNLTGSLLSLYGSQNASIPGADTLNPSQGKTPAAIGLYSDKEANRDGQERTYLEGAIEELTDGFFSLIANIGTEDIPVNLFAQDIQDISDAGLTDVLGILSGNFQANSTLTGGTLRVDPTSLKGVEYRFNITPGSTAKVNRDAQLQQLENLMTMIGKFQNIFKDDPRVEVNWAAMMTAAEELSDLKGAKKFITVKPGPSPQEMQQQQDQQKQDQVAQQARESISMAYKDAPEDIKRQMEQRAGFTPSQTISPSGSDQIQKHVQMHNDQSQAQQPAPPPEPTINKGGMYHDQHVGTAADQITKL